MLNRCVLPTLTAHPVSWLISRYQVAVISDCHAHNCRRGRLHLQQATWCIYCIYSRYDTDIMELRMEMSKWASPQHVSVTGDVWLIVLTEDSVDYPFKTELVSDSNCCNILRFCQLLLKQTNKQTLRSRSIGGCSSFYFGRRSLIGVFLFLLCLCSRISRDRTFVNKWVKQTGKPGFQHPWGSAGTCSHTAGLTPAWDICRAPIFTKCLQY